MDPISFENTGVVEDWVTEPEMYLENDENTDWKALDPPSYNSRLLELSVDEGEDLGSGNQDCMNCELYQSRVMISFLFDVN